MSALKAAKRHAPNSALVTLKHFCDALDALDEGARPRTPLQYRRLAQRRGGAGQFGVDGNRGRFA